MKDIRVYCIKNKPMDMSLVKKGRAFLKKTFSDPVLSYKIVDNIDDLYNGDLAVFFVESTDIAVFDWLPFTKFKPPVLLMVDKGNNCYGLALELSERLSTSHIPNRILCGDSNEVASMIKQSTSNESRRGSLCVRIGLIADFSQSMALTRDVNYLKLYDKFGISLVSITKEEFLEAYKATKDARVSEGFFHVTWDFYELNKSFRVYLALKAIIKNRNLNGLSINCSSFANDIMATACFALDKLSQEGIYVS